MNLLRRLFGAVQTEATPDTTPPTAEELGYDKFLLVCDAYGREAPLSRSARDSEEVLACGLAAESVLRLVRSTQLLRLAASQGTASEKLPGEHGLQLTAFKISTDRFGILALDLGATPEETQRFTVDREVSRMQSSLLHDIRTPLAGAMLMLEKLQRTSDGSSKDVAAVFDSLQAMSRVLASIRSQQQSRMHSEEITSFSDMCDGLLELYGPAAEAHGIELEVGEIPTSETEDAIDLSQLERLISRGIDNALVHSECSRIRA